LMQPSMIRMIHPSMARNTALERNLAKRKSPIQTIVQSGKYVRLSKRHFPPSPGADFVGVPGAGFVEMPGAGFVEMPGAGLVETAAAALPEVATGFATLGRAGGGGAAIEGLSPQA